MRFDNATPFDAQITTAFDKAGHEVVVLAIKASYDFPQTGGTPVLAASQEPLLTADVFGPDPATDAPVFENDFAPFKPRCDILCHGPAMAPGARAVTGLNVGLRLGHWSKAFSVTGARIWLRAGLGHRVSDPRPFVTQPITYDHAWGGSEPLPGDPARAATCEENPVGLGYYPDRRDLDGAPLPLTAEHGKVIADSIGPHRPMAFGPLGRNWLPRRTYAGTYNDRWTETRMPFPPQDFDELYNQAAPPDQQIPYPAGGEPVELVNLTPEGRLRMTLPRERIVVRFRRRAGAVRQKIPNLDTVLFLTEARKLCLTWRSRFVTERDIFDLAGISVTRETVEPGA